MKKWILVGIISLFLILGISSIFYFKVISPSHVKKPFIEKPNIKTNELELNEESSEQAITYIANEIGAYKLHEDPTTGEIPEIEFIIEDTNEIYSVIITKGIPKTNFGEAVNPDMRIRGNRLVILELLNSQNLEEKLVEYVKEGKIEIEVIADEKTLALKGYKAIYDTLTRDNNLISGKVIMEINPSKITGISKFMSLMVLFLILKLSFLYEQI